MDAATQQAKEPQPAKESQPAEAAAAPAKNPIEEFGWLPCRLSVEIPVSRFTIGDLLNLQEGAVVKTGCDYVSDVPLRANGLLIGWTEFEVVGLQLTVRITELA
jgi:flagellar motor switch/type III secretory pathway protein FliN